MHKNPAEVKWPSLEESGADGFSEIIPLSNYFEVENDCERGCGDGMELTH